MWAVLVRYVVRSMLLCIRVLMSRNPVLYTRKHAQIPTRENTLKFRLVCIKQEFVTSGLKCKAENTLKFGSPQTVICSIG